MRRVLFICFTILVGTGCLCGGCRCPKHDYTDYPEYLRAESEHRKKMAQPVVEALEAYKQTTGQYPRRLDDLVTAGLLPAIPDLATNIDHHGRTANLDNAQPLLYSVVDDSYELRFSYGHIPTALTGANSTHFLYVSSEKKWYSEAGFPPRRQPQTTRTATPRTDAPAATAPSHPKKP